ncbi:hypothetical protein MP638_001222 [Amoeboaphelidium occidentale]|nr:hypothetical protein MP638_001222 [Amoeboaphelidium occidentale]
MTTTLNRNIPGTKRQNLFKFPLVPLDQMESSFSIQQYLQLLIRQDAKDISRITEMPPNQDSDVWQYEQLRMVCLQLHDFILLLQEECLPEKCVEMKADEWLYLCAAHQQPTNCSAIDYIVHTLDGATALLNSNKYFPSRVSIPNTSLKHFQSIARRLYRVFAHAWFHHRQVFDLYEQESMLYQRFLKLSDLYQLVPPKLIIIPGYGSTSTAAAETKEGGGDNDGTDDN